MKRLLFFIAALFTMLVYCAAPLISHADNVSYQFYDYDHLDSIYDTNNSDYYFDFQALWSSGSDKYAYTYGLYLNSSVYHNTTISDSNNVVTITFSQAVPMWSCYRVYNSNGNQVGDKPGSVDSGNVAIRVIKIYNDSHRIDAYYDANNRYATYTLYDINSNFDYFNTGDIYNIDVSFAPDLSGNVDRKINDNVSEELSITVENHSRFDVQVLMTIVPRGGSLNFYDRTDDAQDKQISSVYAADSDFSFVWWSDEWNYNFESMIQTSSPHAHHANFSEVYTCSKQYGACPWHFVASGRSVTHKFNWSQIDLVEYGQYDVLVYAIRCDWGLASRQAAYDDADYFVDYSNVQLVYSSSFTLVNGYKFDLNDYSNGNYPVHSSADSINLGWSSKGFIDNDTGETVIKDKKLSDYLDKQHEIQNRWNLEYSQNVYTGSSGSVPTSLKSHFNGFMGFVNFVFDKLPGDIRSIYIFGFVCILVLGIFFKVVR